MKFHLEGTGDLLVTIPTFLGFRPDNALILVIVGTAANGEPRIEAVQHAPLAGIAKDTAAAAIQMANVIVDRPVQYALGVITAPRHSREPTGELPRRVLRRRFGEALASEGIHDQVWLHTPDFRAGTVWQDYNNPTHRGQLPDPSTVPATTAIVTKTHISDDTLAALDARFSDAPEHDRTRIRDRLLQAIRTVELESATSQTLQLRGRARQVQDAITAAGHGNLPEADVVIGDLTAAITTPKIRDTLLDLEPGRAVAAERLCLHLWRYAPSSARARLAGVIGIIAYLRGEQVWAGVALKKADLSEVLTGLVAFAVASEITPHEAKATTARTAAQARDRLGLTNNAN
nr:DUF4192 family protein [Sciscionella marina]